MGERFTVAKEGERPSRSTDVGRVLRANLVLIAGAIAWWGCHYLLLWNADVAAADRFVAGYDSRFMLSIGGTVIALGVLAFAAYRKPGFVYANWAPAYGLFAVLSFVALGLVFTPLFTNEPTALVTVGAVLSGMGNGIAMTIYGELHARLELRVLPLLFALEIVGGGLIFLLSPAWPPVALPLSLALAALCAVCFFRTSRANNAPSSLGSVCGTAAVDMGLRSLVVLAALTGVGYGMARTFTVGVGTPADIANGLTAEWIGSCCSALLLVAVFLFQKRLSLFELCLLFVVPLVATGLWLVSLRGDAAVLPMAINHGGFACFFVLIWYFGAVLAARGDGRRLTFFITILFFASQTSQLAGSLVPAQFSNVLSMSLVYLILVVSMGFMYWRSKTAGNAGTASNGECDGVSTATASSVTFETSVTESASTHRWADALSLSPREEEIAALLLRRTPYRQISESLFISENTVKTHVLNIYKKANVSSREELLGVLTALDQDSQSPLDSPDHYGPHDPARP